MAGWRVCPSQIMMMVRLVLATVGILFMMMIRCVVRVRMILRFVLRGDGEWGMSEQVEYETVREVQAALEGFEKGKREGFRLAHEQITEAVDRLIVIDSLVVGGVLCMPVERVEQAVKTALSADAAGREGGQE